MFPLGTVLFPYAMLPLHVFESRYRIMTRHCLDGDREFGVVLIERGSEVGGGDTRFDTGTVARIVQAAELADGRWALATVGIRRFRVLRWHDDDPYPRAEIEALVEPAATADDRRARDRVESALRDVFTLWRRIDDRVPAEPPVPADDPAQAAFEMAAAAALGPLDAQRVLEAPDTAVRLALLEGLLGERAELLRARGP
jgi:Lon protease-like protein